MVVCPFLKHLSQGVRICRAIFLGMSQLSAAPAHSGVVDRFAAAMTLHMTRLEAILADGLLEEGWTLFPKMHPPQPLHGLGGTPLPPPPLPPDLPPFPPPLNRLSRPISPLSPREVKLDWFDMS